MKCREQTPPLWETEAPDVRKTAPVVRADLRASAAIKPGRRRSHLRWLAVLYIAGWVGPVRAESGSQEIRLVLIDGRPCARCVIACGDRSIPANVTFDLGSRAAVLLHERTAKLLGADVARTVELRFGDLVMPNLPAVGVGLTELEALTRDHATELGELPAVAIIGLPAFKGHTLQLDLAGDVLRLLPGIDSGGDWSAADVGLGNQTLITLPYEEQGHGLWLSAVVPDEGEGFRLRVRFSTAQHDTLIDGTTADLAGAPGGDLDTVNLGPINIARYAALRPVDLTRIPAPHPDVMVGTGLLSHFRVTIDPTNRRMAFEPLREPTFPQEEREYFRAQVEHDAGAIERFLEKHPASRLAAEAAIELLSLRLDAHPPDEQAIRRAVRQRAITVVSERRAQTMVDLADVLLGADRPDRLSLASYVLEVGLEYAPQDINARAAHLLHARMGYVALLRDDLNQARRHLLSASFGMPKDPQVNLWMGQLYERSGRPMRAWSRYAQAVLADEGPPPGALQGLDRLNRDSAFRKSFHMSDAEELLEGRTLEFHPADRFEVDSPDQSTGRVRLVELFSCVDLADTAAPELAFRGLAEYFGDASVSFVQYHLAAPATDPLVTDVAEARARFYGVAEAPMAIFDGETSVESGGTAKEVDAVYGTYRKAALPATPAGSDWRIAGDATATGDAITGTIELTGPAAGSDLRLHVMLCERLVMAPAANGLLMHYQVVRTAVSPTEGLAIPAAGGTRRFPVDVRLATLTEALEAALKRNEEARSVKYEVRSTFVDPSACSLVAFLQESPTRRILAAVTVNVSAAPQEP